MKFGLDSGPLSARICALVFGLWLVAAPSIAIAGVVGAVGGWENSQFSSARLIGGTKRTNGVSQIYAGVEITLQKHWKTYWRQPGEAGGVPPVFDWSSSKNLAEAEVLYPAPTRFKDFGGATVGYKDKVVFPVRIVPKTAGEPVELKLVLSYGICSTICVPVREALSYSVSPQGAGGLPQAIEQALSLVPREGDQLAANDPKVSGFEAVLSGPEPRIVLDVDFSGHENTGDVFVDMSGDFYLPLARKRRDTPGRFVINLARVPERESLRGKVLRVTLVSDVGQSIALLPIK